MKIMKTAAFFIVLASCRSSGHGFTLRDEKPVNAADAPFILITVETKITNLNGSVGSNAGEQVRVAEVGPSHSLNGLDEISLTKIVKSACDASVTDIQIKSQTDQAAEIVWGGSTPKYSALITMRDNTFSIACSEIE